MERQDTPEEAKRDKNDGRNEVEAKIGHGRKTKSSYLRNSNKQLVQASKIRVNRPASSLQLNCLTAG